MSNKLRLAIIIAEVLAVATLRAVYLMRQERQVMPRGSKVKHVRGRPVFRMPFSKHFSRGRAQPEPQDVGPKTVDICGLKVEVADPDQGKYDASSE